MAVKCKGFCAAVFHPKCSGLPESMQGEVARIKQLYWLCVSCSKLMDDIRFRNSVKSAHEAGCAEQFTEHNDILSTLKAEMMCELKSEIRSNFAILLNSNSLTPKTSKRPIRDSTRVRRIFANTAKPSQGVKKRVLVGEGSAEFPCVMVPNINKNEPKFWLYLSRISPEVTTEQLASMVKSRLDSDEIMVFRLVPKGRDIGTLSFVSFKVGIKQELKAKALSTSTWPRGVYFREFEEKSRQSGNFWKPSDAQMSQGTVPQRESSGRDSIRSGGSSAIRVGSVENASQSNAMSV